MAQIKLLKQIQQCDEFNTFVILQETIFKRSKNRATSSAHRWLLNFADKINLKRNDKYAALVNLIIDYTWKNI